MNLEDSFDFLDFNDQQLRVNGQQNHPLEIKDFMEFQHYINNLDDFSDIKISNNSSTFDQETFLLFSNKVTIQEPTIKSQQQCNLPKKISIQPSENDSEQFNPQTQKNRKKTKIKLANPYPTKNFLVNFKKSHIQCLVKHLGKEVLQHANIKQIMDKNGINMLDYQTLYTTQQYRQAFAKYFQLKVPYRDLMHSRVSQKIKKIYLQKIPIFQKSFKEGTFTHIN